MSQELIVPVYLNQRMVFDLLAMLEGGLSRVTRVVSSEQTKSTDERRYGAEFGLSKALSTLLRIDISGGRVGGTSAEKGLTKEEDRVHTPASLFHRLRARLKEGDMLCTFDGGYRPRVSDIVEFSGLMVRNPLIQTMDAFIAFGEMVSVFEEGTRASSKKGQKPETPRTLKQMKAFQEVLKGGDTIDMVAKQIGDGHCQAVMTLEMEYLNDPTMSDLVDGTFTVAGKVTRTVDEASGSISLLRKSALAVMPSAQLKQMADSLGELSQVQGFNLPGMEWELKGPAFQVLPIAIFA